MDSLDKTSKVERKELTSRTIFKNSAQQSRWYSICHLPETGVCDGLNENDPKMPIYLKTGPQLVELFEKHWAWPCWGRCATRGRLEVSQCAPYFLQVAQDTNSQLFCCQAFVLPSWTLNLWNHKPNYMLSFFKNKNKNLNNKLIWSIQRLGSSQDIHNAAHSTCNSSSSGALPYLAYTHKNIHINKNKFKINKK